MSDTQNEDEFPVEENAQTDEPIEMGVDDAQDFQEEDYYEEDYAEFDSEDDFDEMGSDENFQPEFQTKKKSGKLLYILIALVVLGGGGYVLSMLFSGSESPQRPASTAEVVPQQPQEPQIAGFDNPDGPLTPMPEFAEPQTQEDGFVPPPSVIEEMAQESDLPALDTMQESFMDATEGFGIQENTIEDGFDSNTTTATVENDGINATEQAVEMVEATEDMSKTQSESQPEIDTQVEPVVMEKTQQQVSTEASATDVDREILIALNTMSDTIAEMQRTMNSLDVRMNALEAAEPRVTESAPASIPADVATKSDLKSLMSSVDRLETKMLEMQKTKTTVAPTPPTLKPAPTPVLGTRTPQQNTTSTTTSPILWKLQSADPNRAWLVKQGSSAYVPVAVGDTIPGLGKIQFIGQQNGRWVVQGSQASVSE